MLPAKFEFLIKICVPKTLRATVRHPCELLDEAETHALTANSHLLWRYYHIFEIAV